MNWLKPKSMRDIQVFLGFVNFYQHFIQGFSKIAKPFILMLKTNSTTRLSLNLLLLIDVAERDQVDVGDSCDCEDETVKRLPLISKNLTRVIGYLTSKARLAFTQLRKAFIKASIL